MRSKIAFLFSRRFSRLRVLQTGLTATVAMFAWSALVLPAKADFSGSVQQDFFNVGSNTINEGSAESFSLQLSAQAGNSSGFAGTTTRTMNNNTVTFSAPGSTAGSGAVASGGGAQTQGFSGGFTYNQNGTYQISYNQNVSLHHVGNASFATGSDNNDADVAASGSTAVFTVLNVAPTITSANQNGTNGNITVAQGTTVGLNETATDPGADTIAFTINGGSAGSGGNVAGSTRTSSTVNVNYTSVGTFTNTFNATDQDGASAGTVTRTVTVTNVAPQNLNLVLGATTIYEGQTTTAQMTATDPGPDTLTFTIDGHAAGAFAGSPGSTRTSNSVTLGSYTIGSASQVFNIVGSVSDGNGGTSTTSVALTVLHAAPVIDAVSVGTRIPVPFGAADLISIHTDAHSPGGHTLSYAFAFDGGALSGYSLSPDSTLASFGIGTHSVDVHVTDGIGADTITTYTFSVIPEPASVVLAGLGGAVALAMFRRKRKK